MKRFSVVMLVVLMVTMLAMPNVNAQEPKKIVIGYSAPSLMDVGQVTIAQGMLDAGTKLGWLTITTNANQDAQKQITDIENLITLGVSAIVAVPVDSAAIVPAIEKANAAKIPFFTIDRSAFGGKVELTVLSDNYLAGQQAGENMVALLKTKYGEPKGKVIELQGDLGTNVAQLRGKGFDDVIAKYPNIKLFPVATKWLPDTAAAAMEDYLVSEPDLDGAYFHSEYTMPGSIVAAERAGRMTLVGDPKHLFVVAIDGTPDALNLIRKGTLDSTSSQPLYDFGFVMADYIKMVLEGKPITIGKIEKPGTSWSPAEVRQGQYGLECLLSTTLVTKANVEEPTLWGNVLSPKKK